MDEDYPRWDGAPRRTLLVCTQPRSGSTLLGEALFEAKGFGCPLEYFHRGFQPAFVRRWGTPAFSDYLAAVYRHRTDPSGTLGVKLFWPDIEALFTALHPAEAAGLGGPNRPMLDAGLHRKIGAMLATLFPNPTFVYLARLDPLRQAVSALIATQTQVWRQIPGVEEKQPDAAPRFDYQRIAELLALGQYCRTSWEDFFAANAVPFHRVAYEPLADNFPATMQTLFSALGRPDLPVPAPRMRRQANRTSEEMVHRFLGEMRARFGPAHGA